MSSGAGKQSSVLLRQGQIDFLRNLATKIEKECHKKVSRCKIMEELTKTLTRIKPDISKCKSEQEVEKELLKCLRQAVKEPKKR